MPPAPAAPAGDGAAPPPHGTDGVPVEPPLTVRPLLVEVRDGRLEGTTLLDLPPSAGGGSLLVRLVLRVGAPPVLLVTDLSGVAGPERADELRRRLDAVRTALLGHLAAVPTEHGTHLAEALQHPATLWFVQQPPFDGPRGQGSCLALVADPVAGTGGWSFTAGRTLSPHEVGDMATALGLRPVETEVARQHDRLVTGSIS